MGFFAKKDYVCEKCGKAFSKRINTNGNLCDGCYNKDAMERMKIRQEVSGYDSYGSRILSKSYTTNEYYEIKEHRDSILNKYRNFDGISRAELQQAGENYKSLTDEQAGDVLVRLSRSLVSTTAGAVYSDKFFVPTQYSGIIVDVKDVFAVGYTSNFRLSSVNDEAIVCAVFTNDPYIPVFPVVFTGKVGFFELSKSKKGRASVSAMFEAMCPNLTYPVGELKQLKKQIKQEKTVKGNPDAECVLKQIDNASNDSGLFSSKELTAYVSPDSVKMLDGIGYIQETDANEILKMDKMFQRNYWKKQAEKLGK